MLADALDLADDVEAGEAPQELGDHDARFASGQVGSEAAVQPDVKDEPEIEIYRFERR